MCQTDICSCIECELKMVLHSYLSCATLIQHRLPPFLGISYTLSDFAGRHKGGWIKYLDPVRHKWCTCRFGDLQ